MPKYIKLYNSFLNFVRVSTSLINDEYENKIINLILDNFDEIKDTSFAAGKRPRLIVEIIKERGISIPSEIKIETQTVGARKGTFKKLIKLELENFRGFSEKEIFEFDKRMTFICGPNGSGKSSLSEALEFTLLGYINEAIERGMDTAKYTKNAFSTRKPNVKVTGMLEDGKIGDIVADPNNDFCFIERSRIDNFARISARSTKDKQNQLALLFGLEEFFEFNKNFSKTISDKFELEPKSREKLPSLEAKIESRKVDIDKVLVNKLSHEKELDEVSKKSGFENITLLMEHIEGKSGVREGRLVELQEIIGKAEPQKIEFPDISILDSLLAKANRMVGETLSVHKTLSDRKSEVSFKEFFEIALKLEELSSDKCPLCETEIARVSRPPYENAKQKLGQLAEIIELEKIRSGNIESIGSDLGAITDLLKKLRDSLLRASIDSLESSLYADLILRVGKEGDYLNEVNHKLALISQSKESIAVAVAALNEHNQKLEKLALEKAGFREEAKNLGILRDKILKEKEALATIQTNFDAWKKEIEESRDLKKKILEDIEKELKEIDVFKKWSKGYEDFHERLTSYLEKLPIELAGRLGAATTAIYNVLNEHDRDYEIADSIELPKTKEDLIQISFKTEPSRKVDALHVLSEGHLKCLGLAILISKNIDEKCPIVIFDDVVNAIDDDHRRGIINVIFEQDALKEKQIILSTHNDIFEKDLELKASASNTPTLVKTINLQTDLSRRKITVGAESRHHLVKAKQYFSENRIDDCLSRCRKSLENLQGELWKKLSKKYDSTLSVSLNGPNDHPNLKNVITCLVAKIKKEKASEFDTVMRNFEFLLQNHIWDHLNRGTHEAEDKTIPDSAVVKEILDNLYAADAYIKRDNGIASTSVPKGSKDAQQSLDL